jgi:hypothetical protein
MGPRLSSLWGLTTRGLHGLWPHERPQSSRAGVAARTKPRFIEIPRERRSKAPLTEEELRAIRGGRTAEEYRLHLIRTCIKA